MRSTTSNSRTRSLSLLIMGISMASALVVLGGVILMETRDVGRLDAVPGGQPPTVPSARTFEGVGAHFEPVDPSIVPPTSATQALDAVSRNDLVRTVLRDLTPTKMLLVQYDNQFGTEQLDGTDVPSVPKHLAWLAEYDDVHSQAISKPANATAQPRDWTCTYYVAISASSAAVLDMFDICN